MRMVRTEDDPDCTVGTCDACGETIERWRGDGDLVCEDQNHNGCPAIYNASGQRLRDDLYSRPNPSDHDEDIGDMEGYEIAMARGGDW